MKTIKSLLFFGLGILFTILLFEIILSGGSILSPIVKIDPNKGERYYPNKMCCSIFVCEGFGLAKTNSAGWFGKEFVDGGTSDISIAVIGNSFVAARQVFYRDHFLTIAEHEANKRQTNKHISFYNFGKEDLPLKQQLYLKQEIVSTYNPDYIMILINNESFNYRNHRYVPYYELTNNGKLQLDTSFKQYPFVKQFNKYQMVAKSSILFLSNRVKNRIPQAKEILFDKFYSGLSHTTILDSEIFPINPVDETIIKELAKDKRVIFVLDLDSDNYYKVKSLINSSPIIELKQSLNNLKAQGIDPNFWPVSNEIGHWNQAGHKAVGEQLAKGISDILNFQER